MRPSLRPGLILCTVGNVKKIARKGVVFVVYLWPDNWKTEHLTIIPKNQNLVGLLPTNIRFHALFSPFKIDDSAS